MAKRGKRGRASLEGRRRGAGASRWERGEWGGIREHGHEGSESAGERGGDCDVFLFFCCACCHNPLVRDPTAFSPIESSSVTLAYSSKESAIKYLKSRDAAAAAALVRPEFARG